MKDLYQDISDLTQSFEVNHEKSICKLTEEVGELAQSVNKIIGIKGPIKT